VEPSARGTPSAPRGDADVSQASDGLGPPIASRDVPFGAEVDGGGLNGWCHAVEHVQDRGLSSPSRAVLRW
jgi:hypothetical protein